MGGVAIYAAMMVAFIAFADGPVLPQAVAIFGGGTFLVLVGIWDDKWGMAPAVKFAGQFAVALFLVLSGIHVQLLPADWLNVLLTLFWVVGIVNAANLMDNMDGLLAGTAAVASATFLALSAAQGQYLVGTLSAAMLGACLGFLYHNFNPARTFMGDAGSMLLGFMLAVMGIKIRFLGLPLSQSWMIPLIALGALIFDTTLVTASRLRRGRSPFQGGKDHLSHRLVAMGLTPRQAVLSLYGVALAFGAVAFAIPFLTVAASWAVAAGLVAAGLICLYFFLQREPAHVPAARQAARPSTMVCEDVKPDTPRP
jgi:UDP-GlcNAc:undecaprenyl-phosphate GlcNAc-1-phosphate transferase